LAILNDSAVGSRSAKQEEEDLSPKPQFRPNPRKLGSDHKRADVARPACPVKMNVLHPIRQSGSSVNITTSPTKYSTNFCQFGFIFDAEETAQCALSIHASADGPPRNPLGWSWLTYIQLVLSGFPRIRCHKRRECNCPEH
jgi:hypothetical protein